MFVEIAFYVSRRSILGWSFLYFFVLYICSIFEQVFWGYCPKNLDIVGKTAFQIFDERTFLRKLHSSKYFRNFDHILSAGLSRLHFTLLHEKFMEIFFSKNILIFKNFHVSDAKDSKFFCECFFAGMSKQHFTCREEFAEQIHIWKTYLNLTFCLTFSGNSSDSS